MEYNIVEDGGGYEKVESHIKFSFWMIQNVYKYKEMFFPYCEGERGKGFLPTLRSKFLEIFLGNGSK